MNKKISLVYMVAGLSSRFGGKIKQFAKVGINGEIMIEVSLKQALHCKFDKIIFIVGKMTEKPFKEMFGNSYKGIKVEYALQNYDEKDRDKPWGSADALCAIEKIIDGPFIVCNGDDLYGVGAYKKLVEHIEKSDECASLGYKLGKVIPENGSVNRGIIKTNSNGYVKEINEVLNIESKKLSEKKLTSSDLCSMNFFALNPDTIKLLKAKLNVFKVKHKGDRKIECYLPVELCNLIKEGKINMKLYETDEKWMGLTNPDDEGILREYLKKN